MRNLENAFFPGRSPASFYLIDYADDVFRWGAMVSFNEKAIKYSKDVLRLSEQDREIAFSFHIYLYVVRLAEVACGSPCTLRQSSRVDSKSVVPFTQVMWSCCTKEVPELPCSRA
jgi:hypothetical protein